MAQKKAAKKATTKSAKRTTETSNAGGGFSDEERAAMRERAQELKGAKRSSGADARQEDERAVLDKLAAMAPADRTMGERLHAIITSSAPQLAPKLWYGMPAYAVDGKVVCYFQDAQKFKSRYSTFGFSDRAALDDGQMWPTSFALMELTAADEARIAALVKRAVSR
jgi:uncharacterized protein YdhG (YjbR/CyaY superfamily)